MDDANKAVERARLFAKAVQREDWDAAALLLAPDCSYFQVARDVRGLQAIVECFQRDRTWGADQFDSVEQERSAGPVRPTPCSSFTPGSASSENRSRISPPQWASGPKNEVLRPRSG
ncbi:MAG TPA: hypothetical protein VMW24_02390 [Sedimentisphaerales bacterium]|nr:hypothetical protein [Sedimentisphaerales bacterium]